MQSTEVKKSILGIRKRNQTSLDNQSLRAVVSESWKNTEGPGRVSVPRLESGADLHLRPRLEIRFPTCIKVSSGTGTCPPLLGIAGVTAHLEMGRRVEGQELSHGCILVLWTAAVLCVSCKSPHLSEP